jgi:hypothetical protein
MDNIDLVLDSDNELLFKVTVEGTRDADTKCRLMIEREDFSYVFNGSVDTEGTVRVLIPALKKRISEGTYAAHLEVLVDDRIFVPLTFNAKFAQSLKVTAESVSRIVKPKVGATASIISQPTSKSSKKKLFSETSKGKSVKLNKKIDLSGLSRKEMQQLLEKLDRMTGR